MHFYVPNIKWDDPPLVLFTYFYDLPHKDKVRFFLPKFIRELIYASGLAPCQLLLNAHESGIPITSIDVM